MLIESLGVQAKSLHAIGHSLGAHLVGHLGRTIQSDVNEKIIRITGQNQWLIFKKYFISNYYFVQN